MIATVINLYIRTGQVILSTFDRVPVRRMQLPNPPVRHTNLQNRK